MKAFLLAAGLGTRLKPLTDSIPKCLININGKPLLSWWIDLFLKYEIDEVLINLHHLPEKVTSYINNNNKGIKFNYYYEDKLIGSAGTIRENKNFIKNEKEFFIFYADNLTNYNLREMLNFHKTSNYIFTMALFRTDAPQTKGIARVNENYVITDFEEKPKFPKSNLANAGIYISSFDIINYIPDKEFADIGFDLLPKLVNKMRGWVSKDYLIDIGNLEHLKMAELEWPKILGD